jgi:hypothetical protein
MCNEVCRLGATKISISVGRWERISERLSNHYVAGILFGLYFPISLVSLLLAPGAQSISVFAFHVLILGYTASGIRRLRRLRKQMITNSQHNLSEFECEPIQYHAFFWYLPR